MYKQIEYELTSLTAISESNFKNDSSYWFFFQEVMVFIVIRMAYKELNQIQNGSSREWIFIAATLVSQVGIMFVVEHLICSQIHAGMKYLQLYKLY